MKPQEKSFTTPINSNVTFFYEGVLTRKECKKRSTTPDLKTNTTECPKAPKKNKL
jgi:hypothetical protein